MFLIFRHKFAGIAVGKVMAGGTRHRSCGLSGYNPIVGFATTGIPRNCPTASKTLIFIALFSLLEAIALVKPGFGQATQTINTSGTFLVPWGVTSLTVECWGGGGRGSSLSSFTGAGAGGGGGAYARSVLTVVPGATYNVTIGGGSNSTSPGGSTWFGSASTILAIGGNSAGGNSNISALGGDAASCIGDVVYHGGNGAIGTNGSFGGGGGSSGGTGSDGNFTNTTTNQSAGGTIAGGGSGGNGRTGSNGTGSNGTTPGGGGGGALRTSSGSSNGGTGANGRIVVSWACSSSLTSASGTDNQTVCANSGITNITYSLVGASGANVAGLPSGVTGSYQNGIVTISGIPTVSGDFNYTVTAAGQCNNTITGAIHVIAAPQGSLTTTTSTFCPPGGAGFLIFTASAGVGPFTVVYSDGTANRTVNNVTSGVAFPVFTTPVTSTTIYSLVSVTGTNGCVRSSGFTGTSATITVSAPPVISGHPSSLNVSYCQSSGSAALTVIAANATSYQWYSNTLPSNSGGSLVGGATSSSYSPSTASAGALYYYCVVTGPCGSATSNLSGLITVNARPSVTAPTSLCAGSTGQLTPTSGGTWTSSNTSVATVTNGGVITGVGSGNVTFTFTNTTTGCSATTSSVTVTAITAPLISFNQNTGGLPFKDTDTKDSPCQQVGPSQNDIDIWNYAQMPANPTYLWQVSFDQGASWQQGGGPTSTASQYVLDPNYVSYLSVAGTYYFRLIITANGCSATSSNNAILTVTNSSGLVGGTIAADQGFCTSSGDPLAFTSVAPASGATGITYQWQRSNDNFVSNLTTINGATGLTYDSGTLNQTTYFRRMATGGICTAYSNIVTVSIGSGSAPIPPGAISGNISACPSTTGLVYSISSVPNATTYTWSVPGGWTITAGAGTTSITVTSGSAGQNGNITVFATNSCGTSSASSLAVTVSSALISFSLSGTTAICIGNSATITLSGSSSGVSYQLRNNSGNTNVGSPVSGTGGPITFTVNPSSTTTYNVLATGSGCSLLMSGTVTITINALPANKTVAASPSTVCSGSGSFITIASSDAAISYQLRIGTTAVGAPLNGNGGTLNLPTGNLSSTTTFNVLASTAGGCSLQLSGTPTVTVTTPVTPTFSAIGNLCQNTTPPALPTSSTNPTPIYGTWSPSSISTATVGTTPYTFTPNPGQCANPLTINVTVIAGGTPTFNQIGPLCQNASPPALPTSSTNSPAITGTWNPATINTANLGTVVYTFTPNFGQCATTTTMSITILAQVTPTFTQIGPLCQYSTPPALPTSSNDLPPITGSWVPATINTSQPTATYTFYPDAGQCAGTTSMTITITPLVTATLSYPGSPYCANINTGVPASTPLSGTTTTGGTWTVDPPGLTVLASGRFNPSQNAPGIYTVTFTKPGSGGCPDIVASTTVEITAVPTPVLGTVTQPTCAVPTGSVQLTNLPATGSWTISPVNISGTGTTYTMTGLVAKNWSFTVTTGNSCSSAAIPVTLVAATIPPAPTIGTITQPTCTVTTGSVDLSGLPASGTWTLTRNPGAVTTTGTGTTTTVTGLPAGTTYTFTVTNDAACTSLASANVVINSLPSPPAAPTIGTITQPTCSVTTGSVALSGLPGAGTWTLTRSPGAVTTTGTGTTATITGLPASATYTFTVTNAAGCTSVASGNVVINAQPTVPTAPIIGTITQPTCSVATGSVDLSGLPATGTWTLTRNPGAITSTGTGTTTTVSGLAAAVTYTFTVTNAGGCTSVASGNVAINAQPATPAAPIIGTITQPTCALATGSIDLSGLPASGTWTLTLNPGAVTSTGTGTTTTVSGLAASTTYTFTLTNAAGCTSVASANAVLNAQPSTPSAPVIGTITQPTCALATGSIALSGLPATGTWTLTRNPGSVTSTGTGTTTTVSGLAAATSYTFTVTNAAGCTSAASGNADLNAQPATPTAPVIGTITQPTCALATGSVALSGLPATGTWTLTRNPGAVTSTGTGTTTTISGLAASTTYTFTVTNASGCTSGISGNAVLNAQPATPTAPVIGTITQPTCALATGSIDLSGLPATGTWTLTRNPGAVTSTGTGTTTTVSGLAAGTTYNFTVTNAAGCTSTVSGDAILNTQPATPSAPVIGTITQPTCAVATGSISLSGLPATGTWTLTRNPGTVTSTGTGTTTTVSGLAAATTYTFTVTNAAGCTSAISADAIVNAQPVTPSAPGIGTITQPTCSVATGSVDLSGLPASGTWTLTRNPGAVTSTGTGTTTTVSGLAASTTYTFTITNAAGCTSATSADAVLNAQPATPLAPVIGTITQPTCAVATGSINLSGLPATGTWTLTRNPGTVTSTGTGATTTVSGLAAATTYTFTVTNAAGCTSATSADAIVIVQPVTPAAPVIGTITQPTCTVATGSVDLSGLPASGTWTLTRNPGAVTSTGTGTTTSVTGLAASTTYTFTVTNADGCISSTSGNAVINAQPVTPSAPVIGTITQPTCVVGTGSVALSGLPATGTWTINPGSITGTGTTTTLSGISPGTYNWTVTNAAGCTSAQSGDAIIIANPGNPPVPTASATLQPTCTVGTGTITITAPVEVDMTYSIDGTNYTNTTGIFLLVPPGTYQVSAKNSAGCTSGTLAVTINPQPPTPPAPTVTSPVTWCQGATATALTATGTNLLWYTVASGGTGSPTAPVPSTTTPGTTSWWVSQTTGVCEGPRAQIDVIVNPTPPAPVVTSPLTYCQGTTPPALTATGTNLIWYTASTGGTGSSIAPVPQTVTPGTTSYWVSQTTGVCEGPRAQIDVLINPTPGAPAVSSPVTYCQGATAVALTATGTNLLWYTTASGGTGSLTAPTPSTAAPGTTSYWVSQTTGSCEGPRAQIDVTINPTPGAPTVTSPVTYCQGSTAVPLTATGTNLLWYTVASGGTGSPTAPTPSTTTPGTTSYWVSQTTGVCEGPRAQIDVTINATPGAPTVTSPVTYCQGATAVPLTATGTNLLWYTVASGGTGSPTAPTPSTATPGTTSYWVSQTTGVCEGPRAQIDVTINPTPGAPTVTSPVTYCQGVTAVALTATGTNLLWYNSATGGTGSPTAPTPSTSAPGTTSYWVSQTTGICEGPRAQIDVTINPTPGAPTVTSPVTYCQGATAVPLTAIGTNLLWYTTASGGTGSPTAPTPSTAMPGTTSYWVSQTTGVCEGPRAQIDVTINPTPGAPTVTSPVTYCQGATAVPLTATGTNLLWYTTASGGAGSPTAPTPSTATPGTTSYWVSQTSGVCEGPRAKIDVTINPTPGAPTVTSPVTYCQGATAVPLTATGTNLLWYTTASGGTGSPTAPTPSTSTPGTTSYWVSQTTGVCEGPRAQIDVTINPTPGAPTVTSPVTYCQGATAVPLTATGTNLLWYTTASGGTGSPTAPTPSTVTPGTTSWWVSQTTGVCEGPRAKIDVTINPTPGAPAVTSPVTYCQGATAVPLTATGTNLLWYTTASGGTGSPTAPTPSTATPGTTSYWVSQTTGVCEGPRAKIDVTINPTPGAPSVTSPVTYCQGATALPLTATGTNLLWYLTASGGTGSPTAPTPSTATPGTTSYWVSQTTGVCEGPRAQIDVTINPTPGAPTVTSPVTYCQGATAVPLTATGTNLLWYTSASGGTGSATAPTPSTATQGTTSYWVSQTTGVCEGPRAQIDVTINPTPGAPTVTSPVTYCQGATAVPLTATGTNLLWYTVAAGGTGSPTAPTPSTATPGTTSYWVSQTTGACEGPRAKIDVTINPTPGAPAVTSPVTYCQGATAVPLTATGTNLLWYNSASGGTGSPTAPTPSTATPGTTSWWVSQTTGVCEGPRAKIDVTVNPTPGAPTVTSPVTYCQGATAVPLTATGSNLLWYTTATGGTGSPTAPTPSTASPGTTSWWVSQTTGTCEGPRAKIDVTINPTPGAPTVTSPVTYCQGATALPLSATGPNLLWYTSAAGGTGSPTAPTPSTSAPGTTSWWVSQTTGVCEGPRAQIDVTINPTPGAPTVTNPVTYCQGATAVPLTATGSNLLWYSAASGGTGSPAAPTPSTASVGSVSYWVSQSVLGCESPRAQITVTVEVNITPTFTIKSEICTGSTPPVLPGTSDNGFTGSWNPAVVSNTATGTYLFTPDAGQCATTASVTVTVVTNLTPTFTIPTDICAGATAPLLPATSNNGITGAWSPAIVSNTATDTYTFTPDPGQCATTATVTVNVHPVVTPAFTITSDICSGAVPPVLPLSSNNGVTGTWNPATVSNSTSGSYTFTPAAGQCATPVTVSITVHPNVTPIFTIATDICAGATAPSLPTSSNNGITGSWNPATVSNSTSGTYLFTPDAGQCATTASVTVTVHPVVTPAFSLPASICAGSTAPVLPATSDNGIGGTWNPATVSNTATGTYTFTPTAGQCAVQVPVTITVNPVITPAFTPIADICSGSTAPVLPATSTNGITGTWNPSTVSNSATGTYLFTPNPGQCATTTTLTVTVIPTVAPTFAAIGPFYQNSVAPALPGVSTNGITGTWNPATINTATVGTFTYTFTPSAGQCASVKTIDITILEPVLPLFGSYGPYCLGAMADGLPFVSLNNITGLWSPPAISTSFIGTSNYTFTPDPGQGAKVAVISITVLPNETPTFAPIGPLAQFSAAPALPSTSTNGISGTWNPAAINTAIAGTVTYTFTPNAGQCAVSTTMDITVLAAVTPQFDAFGPYCQGTAPDALPSVSNNGITGTWNPATINTSSPGSTNYTFTPNSGQNALTVTIAIVVNPLVTPTFAAIGPFYQNEAAPALPAVSSNGIPGTWNPATISTATVGNFTYTFTPDAGQCASVTTISIRINSNIVPVFTTLGPYCQGDTPGVLPATSNNGISGTWNPATINTATAGSFTFTFTPTPGQGATTAQMTVVVNARVVPTFAAIGPLPQNSVPPLLPAVSQNGIPGTWNPATISTATAGTVTYTFTPAAGQCATTATLSITVNPLVTPLFNGLGPYCAGVTPGILPGTSINGITGTWNPSTINTAAAGTTIYTFTPNPNQGATTATMSITVTANVTPAFAAIGQLPRNSIPPVLPSVSTNGVTGTWNPAVISTANTGTFSFTFTPDAGQCAGPVTIQITVVDGITPTFDTFGPYCAGTVPDQLPTTSNNGITGAWVPAFISTGYIGTFSFTFTPDAGQQAATLTIQVIITPPNFPVFTPIGPLQLNSTAPSLPAISTNGITGTWKPATISTSTLGTVTYTFTPAPGQCANWITMDIQVVSSTVPVFGSFGPYCVNTIPPDLPGTSVNGIKGSWNPPNIMTGSAGTTTYTFTPEAGQGATPVTMQVTIQPNIAPTFASIGPLQVNTAAPALPGISTNGISGTWSPPAISTNTTGTFTYTFTPGAGQCATTATLSVTITNTIVPTFDTFGPYCVGSNPGQLPGTSGNGITGNWFPSAINTSTAGTSIYTFTPRAGQNAGPVTLSITVLNNVVPVFASIGTINQNSAAPSLPSTSLNNIRGTWNPSTINTTVTGTFIYTFTPEPGQCSSTATLNVIITSSVVPRFTAPGPYCIGATPDALPRVSENNIRGTWNPPYIITAEAGTFTFTFTPDPGQDAVSVTMDVTITPKSTPSFDPIGPFCLNSTAPTLPIGSANGIIGSWSPPSINTAVAGTTTYTFTPFVTQCAVPTTVDITVAASIFPTFNAIGILCQNSVPPVLPAVSLNGVRGTWNPATINTSRPGKFAFTFTPTGGGCAVARTIEVTVDLFTQVVIRDVAPLCAGTGPVDLFADPAGGVFNGPGITGTRFYPVKAGIGNHTITYTYISQGGCTTQATTTISVYPAPDLIVTDPAPLCEPALADLTAPSVTAGSTAGLTLTYWKDSYCTVALDNPSAAGAGTWYIRAEGLAPCPVIKPVNVIINPSPTVTYTGTLPAQCTTSTSYLLSGGSPAGGTYSGPGVTGNSFSAAAAGEGIHTITYTYTNQSGCAGSATNTIAVSAVPEISITEPAACTADLTGWFIGISLNSGTLSASSGSITSLGNGRWSIDGIPAGQDLNLSYSAGACQGSMTIKAPNCGCPAITAPASGGNRNYCEGSTVPSINATVPQGFTVDWYAAPSGGSPVLSGNPSFQPTGPGTWYAEARETASGCTSSSRTAVTVTVKALPGISIVVPATCSPDKSTWFAEIQTAAASVSATAGNILKTDNGTWSLSGVPSGSSVTLTAIGSDGCMATLEITAPDCSCPQVAPPLSTGDKKYCEGSPIPAISATVADETTVDWYDQASGGVLLLKGSNSFTPAGEGIWYAEARMVATGCKSSTRTPVRITRYAIPAAPAVTFIQPTCSERGSITVSDPFVHGILYSINGTDYQLSGSFTGLPPGKYQVTARNGGDCVSVATEVILNEPAGAPKPPVVVSPVVLCLNATADPLSASGTGLLWYTEETGGTGSPVAPVPSTENSGTESYYVSQSIQGCESARARIDVIVNPRTPLSVNLPPACSSDGLTWSMGITTSPDAIVTVSAGNLVSLSDISWSITKVPVTTTLVITATDKNGCQVNLSVTAPACNCWTLNPPISNGDRHFCTGTPPPEISATVGLRETVDWYDKPSGGAALVYGSSTYQPTSEGIYYAEARDTVTNCRSGSRTAIIVTGYPLPAKPTVVTQQPTCLSTNGTITISAPKGPGITYSIDGSDYSNSTGIFLNLLPGSYPVTVRSPQGCISLPENITLESPPGVPPPPEVENYIRYCKNEPAKPLTAKGTGLLWYTDPYEGKGTPEAPVPSTITAGKKSFFVSQTVLGCESPRAKIDVVTDFVSIEKVNISPNLCFGSQEGVIEITADGSGSSFSYSVDDGVTYQAGNTFRNLSSADTYSIIVKMDGHCNVKYPPVVTIPQSAEIIIDYRLKPPICETCSNGQLNLNISGGISPYRMTLSGMPIDTITQNLSVGTYEVRVTDAQGCLKVLDLNITPLDNLPNVITPNGDGVNDLWRIPQLSSYPNAVVKVVNMAGKLVFESAPGYPIPWDGRDHGDDAPMGTYYYFISFGPGEKQITGYLTILR